MFFLIRLIVLASYAVRIYSFLLVAYALMSWFPGAYQSPVGRWIEKLVSPYLDLFRPLNLQFGMIDFTVVVAVLVLNFASELIFKFLLSLLV